VTWSMTLLWTVVVPRALGPHQMGLWVSVYSAASILSVVLGLPTRDYLVRRMVAEPAGAPSLIGTVMVIRASLAPVFFGAVAAYVHFAGLSRDGSTLLYLVTGATVLTFLTEPSQGVFQATEQMQFMAYSEVLSKTVTSLAGVLLVLAGFKVIGLGVCALTIAALVLMLNLVWLRPRMRIDLAVDFSRVLGLLRESAAYWSFGIFFMVYLWIDAVMLSLMAPAADVGWYGTATRLFSTLMFIPVILATVWLPLLVRAFESGREHFRAAALAPLDLAAVLGLPVGVLTVVTARPAVDIIFGNQYRGAGDALVILGACVPFMYVNIIFNQVLIASRRPLVWTAVMAGAVVVNPTLNYFLIRYARARWQNGAVGSALSLLLTELIIVGMGVALVGRHVWGRASMLRLTKTGLAAAVMAVSVELTTHLSLVVSVAVGILSFLLAAAALRVLSSRELEMTKALCMSRIDRLRSRQSHASR
jgi:O-antigen/teichoic acid export membrane protein